MLTTTGFLLVALHLRAFVCNSWVNSKFLDFTQQGLDGVADGEEEELYCRRVCCPAAAATARVPVIVGMKSSFIEQPRFRLLRISLFSGYVLQNRIKKPVRSWGGSSG